MPNRGRRAHISWCAAVAATSLFLTSTAWGQAATGLAGAQDARNLDDAEASFRYAREAAAAGDVAGAIAALERVLQTSPDLANIKLELGLLYLRAGNPGLARSYLEFALAAPEAPEEARQRARSALRSATGSLSRFGADATVRAGLQYQSNPNGSPGTVSVTGPGGVPILINGDDLSIPRGGDLSGSASASAQLRYNLESQRGNDLVLDLLVSQTNYVDTTELDATFLNGRFGPRFFFGTPIAPTGYVHPFASGTLLSLGHARYFSAVGGGISFLFRPALDSTISGQIGFERRDYDGSRRRPAAAEQTGDYYSGAVEYAHPLSSRARVSFAALGERVEAVREYWSRTTLGAQIGLDYAFAAPSGRSNWVLHASATYRRSDYGAPDPLVNLLRKRNENRADIELGLDIPLLDRLVLELRASQTWNDANIPNYQFNNSLGAIGLSLRL